VCRGSVQGRDSIDVSISCVIGIGFRGAAPLEVEATASPEICTVSAPFPRSSSKGTRPSAPASYQRPIRVSAGHEKHSRRRSASCLASSSFQTEARSRVRASARSRSLARASFYSAAMALFVSIACNNSACAAARSAERSSASFRAEASSRASVSVL
jgi:hypothetical protein